MTAESFLNRLAEKTVDNTNQLRRGVQQRRNGMEDLYGVVFDAAGDANYPASFYISISPDLVYYERFAFKFIIKPYQTRVTGGTTSSLVTVNGTSLSVSDESVSPNPHSHSTQYHSHTVIKGISEINTYSSQWSVKINNVDITDYLIEQHNGAWMNGEGIYPSENMTDFYDILDVACMLNAEGETEKRDKLLVPGFKKVEIFSNAHFCVQAYLYLKLSHVNR